MLNLLLKPERNFSTLFGEKFNHAEHVRDRETEQYQRKTAQMDLAQLQQHYTSGQCGVLAHVLARRLGWPVWGVFTQKRLLVEIEGWNRSRDYPVHVVVQDPTTTLFADGNGSGQSEDEVLDFYHTRECYARLQPVAGDDYFRHTRKSDFRYALCEQEHLARLLPGLLLQYHRAAGQPRCFQQEA